MTKTDRGTSIHRLDRLDEADRDYIRMRYEQQDESMQKELSRRDVRIGKRFKELEVREREMRNKTERLMKRVTEVERLLDERMADGIIDNLTNTEPKA